MTQFIFHSSRCLMLTKDWPKKPSLSDFPYHDRAHWFKNAMVVYDQAKQDAIDTAVLVTDEYDINKIRWAIWDNDDIIQCATAPEFNEWQPAEDTPYQLEIEMEIQGINYEHCPECHSTNMRYDETWQCGDCTYEWEKRFERQVARIKKEGRNPTNKEIIDMLEKQEYERGLYHKYIVEKTNGQPIDANAEYFVLRLDDGGDDLVHIEACRSAIRLYAEKIANHLPQLSQDILQRWPVTGEPKEPAPEQMSERLDGFYWVKFGNEWTIAERNGSNYNQPHWNVIALEDWLYDKHFEIIGELLNAERKEPDLEKHSWDYDESGNALPPKSV